MFEITTEASLLSYWHLCSLELLVCLMVHSWDLTQVYSCSLSVVAEIVTVTYDIFCSGFHTVVNLACYVGW